MLVRQLASALHSPVPVFSAATEATKTTDRTGIAIM